MTLLFPNLVFGLARFARSTLTPNDSRGLQVVDYVQPGSWSIRLDANVGRRWAVAGEILFIK